MFPKLVLLCPSPYPLFFLEEYLLRHSLWSDRLAFPHLAHCGNRGSFVVSFWMWVEMWPTRVEGVQGDPVLLVGCPGSSVSDEVFCSGKQPLVLCCRALDWQHEGHLGNTLGWSSFVLWLAREMHTWAVWPTHSSIQLPCVLQGLLKSCRSFSGDNFLLTQVLRAFSSLRRRLLGEL